MPYLFENPFTECTARDMEYTDVTNYWCQPYEFYEGLDENTLLHSITPIFVEGARGSGKTMILKHLSFFCQKEEFYESKEKDILTFFANSGSIGVYYRFKNDFGKLLAALNCPIEIRREIFAEYFQLYYSRELIKVIQSLHEDGAITAELAHTMIVDNNNIFKTACLSFLDLQKEINIKIEKIDLLIRRLKYLGNISEELSSVISGEPYITKVFDVIRTRIPYWSQITLLLLIDEYENIAAFQKTVNTYIKQTEAQTGITYRIGMRPESATYGTYISGEQLQNGRDYLLVSLHVTNPKRFQRFLIVVAEKRLRKVPFFKSHGLTRIEKILGRREDWVEEALNATKNRPGVVLECIAKDKIEKYGSEELKELLSYPDNPLIEMLNVLWVNRGKTPQYTSEAMRLYLEAKRDHKTKELKDNGRKYYLDYEMKYKYSLLFALLSNCGSGARKKYYSFTTFSYLACGSVNDFLSLCRNTFMAIDKKSYDLMLAGQPIPPDVQDRGAREAASEQLDKIRLCEDSGTEMYTFAMNLGEVFRYYHKDIGIQFPETNQFAFENEAEITSRGLLKQDLSYMVKWGVVEEKGQKQMISIGRRRGHIYALNKMFAPIFGISYRTRGGYNFVIKTDVFEQMLSNSMDAQIILNQNKKKHDGSEKQKHLTKNQDISGQMSLFEGV